MVELIGLPTRYGVTVFIHQLVASLPGRFWLECVLPVCILILINSDLCVSGAVSRIFDEERVEACSG